MASQTDKKEEFRKYLEKGKVLHVLTTVLTDLFEMDNKPEDPLSYLHHRFGESLSKPPPPPNGPQKDLPMSDPTPTPPTDPAPPAQTPNHHSAPQIPADQPPSQSITILQHNPLPANPATAAHPANPSVPQINAPAPAQAPVQVNPAIPVVAPTNPTSAAQIPDAQPPQAPTPDAAPAQSVQPPAQPASAAPPAPAQVSQPVTTNPAPVQ